MANSSWFCLWYPGRKKKRLAQEHGPKSWPAACRKPSPCRQGPSRYIPDAPWCWYIYLQNWLIYGVNVGIHIPAPWSIWVSMRIQLEYCIRIHCIRVWEARIQGRLHIFSYTKHRVLEEFEGPSTYCGGNLPAFKNKNLRDPGPQAFGFLTNSWAVMCSSNALDNDQY